MNQPSEFEKKLRLILEEPFSAGWSNTMDKKVTAIMGLVRGIVPEVNNSWGYGSSPEGWNACRRAILASLGEGEV